MPHENSSDTTPTFGRIYSIWDKHLREFVYVGQTITRIDYKPHGALIRKQWDEMLSQDRYVYCIEREWDSIQICDLAREETRFIWRRGTFIHGLNQTANGGRHGPRSRSSRKKQSDTLKNMLKNDPNRLKDLLGRRKTPEAVANFKKSMIDLKESGFYKKVLWDPAVAAKRKATRAKTCLTEEFKKSFRLALKKRLLRPDYKKNHADAIRRAYADPDLRRRKSESVKAAWKKRKEAGYSMSSEQRQQIGRDMRARWEKFRQNKKINEKISCDVRGK